MGIKEHISQGDCEYYITAIKQILGNMSYITNSEFKLYKLEVILLNWNWQHLSKNLIANIRMGVSLDGNISPNRTSAKLKLSSY